MADGTWSEERVEALRELWGQGLSARAIADRLGGLSRNMVIGKLDRLGLLGSRQVGNEAQAGPGEGLRRDASRKPRTMPPPVPAQASVTGSQARTADAPLPHLPVRPARPVPAAEPAQIVSLQDLKTSSCRWPLGHPGGEGFGFCGGRAVAGRPYCESHARLAYEPPRERKRA